MATSLSIRVDTSAVAAVCGALATVVERLPTARGRGAAALRRRLQRIADGERAISAPTVLWLGGGRIVALPPRELVALIERAAELRIL